MRATLGRVLRIARRDYVAAVFTKGFVIGLVLAPLMMCGGLLAIPLMQRAETGDRRIAVLDHTGSLREALAEAAEVQRRDVDAAGGKGRRYRLEFPEARRGVEEGERQILEVADRIRAGQLEALVEIGADVLLPREGTNRGDTWIRYYARGTALDDARGWLDRVLNQELRRRRLVQAGLDPVRVSALTARVPVEGMSLPGRDRSTGRVESARRENELVTVGIPFGAGLLMLLLVMMGALPLLQGVVEEKSQRIAEVLLGCATPMEIMTGKLLAGVGVALTGTVFYLGTGLPVLASVAGAVGLPLRLIPWMTVYVLAAVLMYGSVAVALGAACSDPKDAQHLQLPVMLPLMLPVMMLMPILKDPNGLLATVLSLLPPFTPLLMVVRLTSPAGVPGWQAWLGLAGVVLTTVAVLGLAGRIFRVGILVQGKPPRLAELWRWGLRG